ncbi:MAG: lipid transporter ATP-binding/permease [Gammaproteobacteria bacterium]|jgi:subfamily B ATP-binding cassette protein MsbA|nr:lipid transporter ATP-binding/permease [Gammaproteobacteria bacterium]
MQLDLAGRLKSTMKSSTSSSVSGFSVYRRLLTFVLPYWPVFLVGIIATALTSLIEAGFVGSIRPIMDKGLIDPNLTFLRWLPLMVIGAFLFRGTASFISNYCLRWLSGKVIMTFRQILFRQYIHMPTAFYDQSTSGELLSKVLYNVDQVAAASTTTITTLLQEGFFVLGLLGVMFINSWRLSLFFLFVGPIIAITVRVSNKRLRNLSKRVQVSMGEVAHLVEEVVEGHRVVKAFGGQAYEINKFETVTWRNFRQNMKRAVTDGLATPIVQLMLGFIIAAVIFLGTLKTGHLNVSPGAFVAMMASMAAILKPVKNLTKLNTSIQAAIAGAESVFELVDAEKEPDRGTLDFKGKAKGHIEYNHVSFNYATSASAVLKNICFTIEPGQTLALVGRSGAGKSTLANLLPRFYHDYNGIIKIDGHDSQDYRLHSLREQIALVTQQVTLFNASIRDNIAYGQFENASEEAIRAAAEAAHILDFVNELPEGFNTIIGENGILLSGGQRQRLAIARAILKNAPILILDEATSSLDTESERYIQDALDKLIKNRTTLVIAHRLSTIEKANKIVVLDKGEIIEIGDHKTLLAADGMYAKLYKMQFKDET